METQADQAKRRLLTLLAEMETEGVMFSGHWSGVVIINAQHVADGGDGSYAEIGYLDADQASPGAAAELAAMGPA